MINAGLSQRAEAAAKVLVLIVGAVYAMGGLVTSAHLARFGIATASPLRVQYFLSGGIAWGLLVLPWLFNRIMPRMIGRVRVLATRRALVQAGEPVILFLVIMLVGLLLGARAGMQLPGLLDYLGWTLALSAIVMIVDYGAGRVLAQLSAASEGRRLPIRIRSWAFLVAGLSMYVAWFVLGPFGGIPAGLGGGKPVRMRFVLLREADTTTTMLSVDRSKAGLGLVTKAYPVVFRDERDVYLLMRSHPQGILTLPWSSVGASIIEADSLSPALHL